MMEKRNVVETRRTPDHELHNSKGDWDKNSASSFNVATADAAVKVKQSKGPVADGFSK